MTKWTKIEKTTGHNLRDTPAVHRPKAKPRAAYLMLPESFVVGERADVFHNCGLLAFRFGDSGNFSVLKTNAKAKANRVYIPVAFADLIPFGTTDAVLTEEDGMLVLDTSQFKATA